MININKFWKDIEADDKAIKKAEKMIERKESKEFERWEKKQKFWRKEKSIDWL